MLILSRRPSEMVRLHTSDGIITVRLYDCKDRVARLGFEAPSNVTILRAEIDDTDDVSKQLVATRPFSPAQGKTIRFSLRKFLAAVRRF